MLGTSRGFDVIRCKGFINRLVKEKGLFVAREFCMVRIKPTHVK